MPATPSSRSPPSIVSVCRALPSDANPSSHSFVLKRLAAMARLAPLEALEPVPYFPIARPLPASCHLRPRERAGVRIEPMPMLHLPGFPGFNARAMRRAIGPALQRRRQNERLDIIDAHFGYPEGVACVPIARKLGAAVFITLRGLEVDLIEKEASRRPLVEAINLADGCICVSHYLRRTLAEAGADPACMTVIHNAVDRAVFRPGDRQRARLELGVDVRQPLIVSVGRLVSGKRHHVLLESFARLRASCPSAMLCIIGGPSFESTYPDRLKQMARELGGDGAVRIAGALPALDVVRWLQAADVFALGTEREGCCNAVLEALAVGVPVVTTPVGDNQFFVQDDRNGYLVPVDDVLALEVALARAIRRNWDQQSISSGLDVGDWSRVASRVVDYFVDRTRSATVRCMA